MQLNGNQLALWAWTASACVSPLVLVAICLGHVGDIYAIAVTFGMARSDCWVPPLLLALPAVQAFAIRSLERRMVARAVAPRGRPQATST